jgi:predicted small lipoprotein YifL
MRAVLIFSQASFRTMRALLPLIVLASSLAGCGYKDALYLPKSKPAAQKPAAPPPAQQQEKKAPE